MNLVSILLVVIVLLQSEKLFAKDQEFDFNNSISASELNSELNNYNNIIEQIVDNTLNQGLVFHVKKTEIKKINSTDMYEVRCEIATYLKRDIVERNIKLASGLTKKSLVGNILDNGRQYLVGADYDTGKRIRSFVEFKRKDGSVIIDNRKKEISFRLISIYEFMPFVTAQITSGTNRNDDIWLSNDVEYIDLTANELENLKGISIKSIKSIK